MDLLMSILNWLTDHWKIITIALPIAYTFLGKLGRVGVILICFIKSMQDRVIGDTEMATLGWMTLSVLLGLTPHVSYWLLNYAPDVQVAILKANGFIKSDFRPEIAPANGGVQ